MVAKPAAPRARKSTSAKPAAPAKVNRDVHPDALCSGKPDADHAGCPSSVECTATAPVAVPFADLVAVVAERNDTLRSAAGSVIAEGANLYWTARIGDMLGADKIYATEGALFEGAMHFAKSQGSTLKRLATTVHVHGFDAESPEFRVVRDRGGMAWAKFLTPVAGDVPPLTDAERTALANVARYNDGPESFVAGTAAKIVAGTVQIDDAGKPVAVVLPDTRQANPNDGTGTGGDDAEHDAAKSNAPQGVASALVAGREMLARMVALTIDEIDEMGSLIEAIQIAYGERVAVLVETEFADADAEPAATA